MPLSRYASECRRIAEEFEQYLQDEDRDEVERLIGSLSLPEWFQWRAEKTALLESVVAAPPRARAKALEKLPRPEFLLTVLAARQRCLEAAELLRAVADAPWVGNSYRGAAAHAGTLCQQMAEMYVPLYPAAWGEHATFREG